MVFLDVLVAVALLNLKVPIGQFCSLSLVTVPELFAKVNPTQFPSRF